MGIYTNTTSMIMNFKPRHLIYSLTAYASVQLIGFLGTAYKSLSLQMSYIVLFLILIALIIGIAEWLKAQSKVQHKLDNNKVFACFVGSFVLIALIVFALFIGAWIAV